MDYRTLTNEFAAADRLGRRRDHLPRRNHGQIARDTSIALTKLAVVCVCLLGLLSLITIVPIAWNQEHLIYSEVQTPIGGTKLPPGTILRRYATGDSGTDYAAYVHKGDTDKPTVVYLHGRGEHLSIAWSNTSSYARRGWTVVVPEYPGFSGLRGHPSERSIGRLIDLVHDDLAHRNVDPRRLVIHGNSLGAGPAMQLAQYPHGMLLLTAPVARLSEVVNHWVPFMPTLLLRDRWDNAGRARTRYPAPAVVIQAVDDEVVPVAQGREMAQATGARFIELDKGGHSVGWKGEDLRYTAMRRFEFKGDEPHEAKRLDTVRPKTEADT